MFSNAKKMNYKKHTNKTSSKDIQITQHAKIRAEERLNITKKDELKKLCHEAKYKGINISLIRRDTYKQFGLTWEEYKYIKGRFTAYNNSTSIYFYKGNIFVFVGKGQRTLRTVIKCGG